MDTFDALIVLSRRRSGPRRRRATPGFTLIEVMVAVAMIALLAALALPSYRGQIARGRRAEVITVLLEDAQYMERYYASHGTYDGDPPAVPTYGQAPRQAGAGGRSYTIAIEGLSATGYTLVALRDPAGPMVHDPCGDLTYDSLSRKGLRSQAPGLRVEDCWR